MPPAGELPPAEAGAARPAGRIDLHAHTTASDGLLQPEALVDLACSLGLEAVAITDHDTAAGVRAVAGRRGAVEVIPGIEVSSGYGASEVHILGYFIDPFHPRLFAYEDERRVLRRQRLEAMVEALRRAGMDVTMAEVDAQIGGDGAPGRPHLARALVARGFARDTRECFQRLFAPGGPAYVPYDKLSPEQAVELIEAAGGVAVLAHPALDGVDRHLDPLVASGIRGIEVWHSAHGPDDTARLGAYARAHGLLVTGGSDFHGPAVREGAPLGAVGCPPEHLAALRRAVGAEVEARP